MSSPSLALLKSVPKTEMHLHLEGAIPYGLLQTLGSAQYAKKPASWADDYRFARFSDFDGALLGLVMPWFNSPERYGLAAAAVFARLRAENVSYLETSFASGVLQFLGLDGAAVAEAIHKAAPPGMQVRVFLGIHHDGRPPAMEKVLTEALSWKYLDGIDLHGDETVPLEAWTGPYWAAARAAGKFTKAHAGEFCGPVFVRQALEVLGVRQIEHGVRAVEDPALVRQLAAEGVILDVCPTSNIKLRVSGDYASHPLRALRQAGVRCTLNSDDPLIFGKDLLDEYETALTQMGFSVNECLDIIAEGWRAAKIDEAARQTYLTKVEAARQTARANLLA